MSIIVTAVAGSLGPSPCYNGEQARYNAFTAATEFSLPNGYTTVITQSTAPGPDQRGYIWCQVDGSNRIVGFFTFCNGSWQTINPTVPYLVPGEFREYDPALYTPIAPWFPCDGSVTGVPDRRGTSPVCTGQRVIPPTSTDTATVYVSGVPQGRETLILTAQNICAHTHLLVGIAQAGPSSTQSSANLPRTDVGAPEGGFITGGNTTGLDVNGNPLPPVGANTVPPVYPAAYMQWRPDLA